MNLFLMWHNRGFEGREKDPVRVGSNLKEVFSPLFSSLPKEKIMVSSSTTAIVIRLPERRWKPKSLQEDEKTWAIALSYPINARRILVSNGITFREETVLPILCRKIREDPTALIKEMAPPFSLIWSDKKTGDTWVQNDGLGLSCLYEYNNGKTWVLTNRIFALKALDIPLEPDCEQWAVRSTLGWFPQNMTGYKSVTYLDPGAQLHLKPDRVRRKKIDVLSGWLSVSGLSRNDCLELARLSLHQQVKDIVPFYEKPALGLTGGWDSRVVGSTLRAVGVHFSAHVRGLPDHPDVIIASDLAKVANINLKISNSGGLPSKELDACRRSISLALLWQAGHRNFHKHKTFLVNRQFLSGGKVEITGNHGDPGGGYYYAKKILELGIKKGGYDDCLVEMLVTKMPVFMRKTLKDSIREIIHEACSQANQYGLEGAERWDFFYLFERIRRWASASLSSKAGFVFAPLLNPDFIRASFAYPSHDKSTHPFHKHIVAINAPDWSDIPHENEFGAPSSPQKRESDVNWIRPTESRSYDTLLYWNAIGRPIIEEAICQGGFWTEIFDPDLVKMQWKEAPDTLGVVHFLQKVL